MVGDPLCRAPAGTVRIRRRGYITARRSGSSSAAMPGLRCEAHRTQGLLNVVF